MKSNQTNFYLSRLILYLCQNTKPAITGQCNIFLILKQLEYSIEEYMAIALHNIYLYINTTNKKIYIQLLNIPLY